MGTLKTLLFMTLEFVLLFAIYASGTSILMLTLPYGIGMTCSAAMSFSLMMVVIYIMIAHHVDKRTWNDILHFGKTTHLMMGFVTGAIFMTIVVGVIALMGNYHIIKTYIEYETLIKMLILFFYVGVSEELLFRGVIYKHVKSLSNTYVAIGISGLLFGFMHIMNDNATVWSSIAIAIEAGCMLGAAYEWSKTLLFPIGIHWAWNYFEGTIYGTQVSGNSAQTVTIAEMSGSDIITGGPFGPEASIVAVVAGTILTAIFVYLIIRSKRKEEASNVMDVTDLTSIK